MDTRDATRKSGYLPNPGRYGYSYSYELRVGARGTRPCEDTEFPELRSKHRYNPREHRRSGICTVWSDNIFKIQINAILRIAHRTRLKC
eukprot:scaffold425613_cov20-Prasinocladus_malaysianus.AAC.1